jgi:hypothetical protein
VLVAAAVCPHPPLLIPAAAGAAGWTAGGAPGDTGTSAAAHGTGGEAAAPDETGGGEAVAPDGAPLDDDAVLERLRAACHTAVAELFRAEPDLVVVVGGARATGEYSGLAAGSLAEFGVPVTIGSGPPVLPLSLTIGAWLLRSCGLRAGPGEPSAACELPSTAQPPQAPPPPAQLPQPVASPAQLPRAVAPPAQRLLAVARDTPAPDCLRLGARLAAAAPRVAMLAMGDGSARKATGLPGAPDPAADQYDAEVAAALAAADPDRLARLDAELDEVLSVAGRAAWQVLAGAAAGGQLRGTLRCAVAPFGVSYLVASWDWSPGPLED